jgi:hypothetical protein
MTAQYYNFIVYDCNSLSACEQQTKIKFTTEWRWLSNNSIQNVCYEFKEVHHRNYPKTVQRIPLTCTLFLEYAA